MNLYAYCENNPLYYVDSSGHNNVSAADHPQLPAVTAQPGTQLPVTTASRVNPQPDTPTPSQYSNHNPLVNEQNTQVSNATKDAGGTGETSYGKSSGKPTAFSDLPRYEQPRNTSSTGRARNNIGPNKNANGKHVVHKADPQTGKVTNYKVYEINPKNPSGFNEILGYDGIGRTHTNKITNEDLLPHMHDPREPGGVRAPNWDEIP